MDNENINMEKEARINALNQILRITGDEIAVVSYAQASEIDIADIPRLRRAWIRELRELEGNPYTLDEIKADAILETRFILGMALETPIEFNGKLYSVTLEKQNLLSAQLNLFGLNAQNGVEMPLQWNATGQPCEDWAFKDLLELSNTIAAYVAPLAQLQRFAEVDIKAAKNEKGVQDVVEKYRTELENAILV